MGSIIHNSGIRSIFSGGGRISSGDIELDSPDGSVSFTVDPVTKKISLTSVGADAVMAVHGSRVAPVVIDSSGLTVVDERRAIYYLKSDGGAVAILGNQISAGFQVGDELILIGVDQTDYPIFSDGGNLELNGLVNLKAGPPGPGVYTTKRYLIWDGSKWSETPMT